VAARFDYVRFNPLKAGVRRTRWHVRSALTADV